MKSPQLTNEFISCSVIDQSNCTEFPQAYKSLFTPQNSSLHVMTSLSTSSVCCPLACNQHTSSYSFTFFAVLLLAVLSSVGHRDGSSVVNASILGYLDDIGKKRQIRTANNVGGDRGRGHDSCGWRFEGFEEKLLYNFLNCFLL